MTDEFEKTFVVEIAPADVWQRLVERTIDVDGQTHYVLPGFPSMQPLPIDGASCTPIEVETERLLRVRKITGRVKARKSSSNWRMSRAARKSASCSRGSVRSSTSPVATPCFGMANRSSTTCASSSNEA